MRLSFKREFFDQRKRALAIYSRPIQLVIANFFIVRVIVLLRL